MESVSEVALTYVGGYSRWQITTAILCSIGFGLVFPVHILPTSFITHEPEHHCNVPLGDDIDKAIPNVTNNGKVTRDSCIQFSKLPDGNYSNATVSCQHGWFYLIDSEYEQTVVSTWDLVCNSAWLIEFSSIFIDVGTTVGCLLPTLAADVFGRRLIYLSCTWITIVLSAIQAMSPSLTFFTTLGAIAGVTQQGMVTVSFVMVIELFSRKERTFGGLLPQFVWCLSYSLLAMLFYLIRHWRHLLLTLNVPLFMTIVLLWTLNGYLCVVLGISWFIPESIPWLVTNKKRLDAEDILRQAARYNNKSLPPKHLLWQKPEDTRNESGSVMKESTKKYFPLMDIVTSSLMRRYTAILLFIWTVNYFAYITQVLKLTDVFTIQNKYLNFFLYAAIEVPPYIATFFILQRFGRRLPFCAAHVIGGTCILLSMIESLDFAGEIKTPVLILFSVVIKMCFVSSFATVYIVTTEIYPTNIRCTGLGVCKFFTGVVSHVPLFFYVHESWIPRLILGICTIIAAFLIFLLPETRHNPLPESVGEVEQWERHREFRYQNTEHGFSGQPTDKQTNYTLTDDMEDASTTVQSSF